MEYPQYLLFASEEEVAQFKESAALRKQREILAHCDNDLQPIEINGEMLAAIDLNVYQYLVKFLRDHTK